jgi:hypothetical protein
MIILILPAEDMLHGDGRQKLPERTSGFVQISAFPMISSHTEGATLLTPSQFAIAS